MELLHRDTRAAVSQHSSHVHIAHEIVSSFKFPSNFGCGRRFVSLFPVSAAAQAKNFLYFSRSEIFVLRIPMKTFKIKAARPSRDRLVEWEKSVEWSRVEVRDRSEFPNRHGPGLAALAFSATVGKSFATAYHRRHPGRAQAVDLLLKTHSSAPHTHTAHSTLSRRASSV